MKTLALVIAMTAVSAGQSGGESIAGSWAGQFQGRTFLSLELQTANGTITGGISMGDIEVDEKGALRRVGELPPDLTPISDATQRGSVVTFSRTDGSDTDRLELRLLEPGHAELVFLLTDADRAELAASGVPTPKPIRLTKQ